MSNGGAYTKHIYAASQRIASKLGNEDGFGADPRRVEQAGGKKISDIQKDNIGARFSELGFTYTAPEKEKVEKDSTMDSEEEEKLIFFYHPDHLGSTSYVTDADGNIAQHIEYIPYGEVFVEERNNSFSTNYLFNAKELDNETGFYYYGARYLDPTGAMWLSVDPMWEKYAGMSPYNYCAGNPVKLVDPDGRENMIYLVDLQTEKKIDVQKLIESVNQAFESLGLETRMMLAPGGKDFDPEYMDNTDSYVAFGPLRQRKGTDVTFPLHDFICQKSPEWCEDYRNSWEGGKDVPEHSSLDLSGKKTPVIALDVTGIVDAASEYNTDAIGLATFLVLHGAGHNAGMGHPDRHKDGDFSSMLMNSGNWHIGNVKDNHVSLTDNFGLNPSHAGQTNFGYVKTMSNKFGRNKAQCNYYKNRKDKYKFYKLRF